MANIKYKNLNLGHKFILHKIVINQQIDDCNVVGEVSYVRESAGCVLEDDTDKIILNAIQLVYPSAKPINSEEYVNENQDPINYVQPYAASQKLDINIILQWNYGMPIGNQQGFDTRACHIPLRLTYNDDISGIYLSNNIDFKHFVFMNVEQWNDLTSEINSSLCPSDDFFL